MIPESVEPGQAPGGILAIAFDLDDNEVTRSVVTRSDTVDFMAKDAGMAVHARGGGRMVIYDGDTGERTLIGPKIALDANGLRVPTTHDIGDLEQVVEGVLRSNNGEWPWGIIGVFKAESQRQPDDIPQAWWDHFCYTLGFPRGAELWTPCASIEGRGADHDLIAMVLNRIACGCIMGWINPGDTVIVPMGVAAAPEAEDVNTIWWIGELEENDGRRQVHQSDAMFVLPILWSSPLGFEYVTQSGKVLTDDDLQDFADEAERGYDVSGLMNRKEPDD